MNARLLARLPIFAAAGLIGFLFLANLWNFAVERDWPKLRVRSAEPLNGLSPRQPAPWTLAAFLSGETQHAVSKSIGVESPAFPISVRAKNQLLYSLFGISGAANVVVGRDLELFGAGHIDEFCARGAPQDETRMRVWVDEIAQIAVAARARGKSFVYLIAPSKVAYMRQKLPRERFCRALALSADTDKRAPFRAALTQQNVPLLDTAELFHRERGNYPIDLFPRGGIHWNLLGAALTLRETTQIFAAQSAGSPIGDFQFDWRERDVAQGDDRDLVDLLNLLWPDDRYPTATISRRGSGEDCAKTPRLLLVGDSFLRQLVLVASQAPCPPNIDYWSYMRNDAGGEILGRFHIKAGEIGEGERVVAVPAQLAESFAQADAVLLEENEYNIGQTTQVGALAQAARALE